MLERPENLMGSNFAKIFDKVSQEGKWRSLRVRDRPNLKISIRDGGSHIETDPCIPVVKIELLFDPKIPL